MSDIFIIVIILVIICVAIVPSVKHFKGQGGCCGGGSYKPKKKRLGRVITKKIFQVEGMHCENCSNKVMEAVNDISGVSAVVNLKKAVVEISYEKYVEDSVIIKKIEKIGYTVIKVT